NEFGGPRNYFYPLVLIPLAKKLYPHFTGFMPKLLETGKALIQHSDEIYLIGYRAKDEIIQELFANVSADSTLHVVGVQDASDIMREVLEWAKLKEGTIYKNGFESFIEGF